MSGMRAEREERDEREMSGMERREWDGEIERGR